MASSSIPPNRIFITGGAGFVGRAIIWRLQQTHPDWILFSYDKVKPDLARRYNPPVDTTNVTWLEGDITDIAAVSSALAKSQPTVVVHTAGVVPHLSNRYTRTEETFVFKTNIFGTQVMLDASKVASSVKAFVWTGSVCAVIDDTKYQYPCINELWQTSKTNSTIYGESKARAEPFVLQANNPSGIGRNGVPFLTTALRPSVLFGPEDYQLIPSIHACIAKKELPYIIGDGSNLWDVTDVRNVAHIHVLTIENLLSSTPTAAGEAILFGNESPITFRDFCCYIWSHWDAYPSWQIHIPIRIASAVGGISDFFSWMLGLETTLSRGSVYDAVAVRYVDDKKAERVLGYKPIIGLEQALHESCLEYKRRLELRKTNGKAMVEQASDGKHVPT